MSLQSRLDSLITAIGTDIKALYTRSIVVATFSYTGTLTVVNGTMPWYNDSGRTLTIFKVRASVGVAPTGQSILVDLDKNGTTTFTTTGNRPEIAVSTFTDTGVPDVTSVADGDYLKVNVEQIGTTIAGEGLVVTVWMR